MWLVNNGEKDKDIDFRFTSDTMYPIKALTRRVPNNKLRLPANENDFTFECHARLALVMNEFKSEPVSALKKLIYPDGFEVDINGYKIIHCVKSQEIYDIDNNKLVDNAKYLFTSLDKRFLFIEYTREYESPSIMTLVIDTTNGKRESFDYTRICNIGGNRYSIRTPNCIKIIETNNILDKSTIKVLYKEDLSFTEQNEIGAAFGIPIVTMINLDRMEYSDYLTECLLNPSTFEKVCNLEVGIHTTNICKSKVDRILTKLIYNIITGKKPANNIYQRFYNIIDDSGRVKKNGLFVISTLEPYKIPDFSKIKCKIYKKFGINVYEVYQEEYNEYDNMLKYIEYTKTLPD